MKPFNKKEKEQIFSLLKKEIPEGFSLNASIDLQLDNENYQAFTINSGNINILYLLVPADKQTSIYEIRVGRLCKKYNYTFGHYIKCYGDKQSISTIVISQDIDKLK